jgi:hypothetical protein
MRDFRDAKAMARALREALKAKAFETTHAEALGERKRSGPALPTRSPMASGVEEVDTFTIPNGGRQRVYRPCCRA